MIINHTYIYCFIICSDDKKNDLFRKTFSTYGITKMNIINVKLFRLFKVSRLGDSLIKFSF